MKHIEGFSALVRLAMVGVDHQNWEDEDLQVAHKFVLGSSPGDFEGNHLQCHQDVLAFRTLIVFKVTHHVDVDLYIK